MIKAVLLDLDNTLLHNPDSQFAAAFRKQFERHFLEGCGVTGAADALRRGIKLVIESADGRLTNAELMFSCLADGLGISREAVSRSLESFCEHEYNQLRALSSPLVGADQLIESLVNANVLIAIATNPIYPETAVLRRLEWAGLSRFLGSFAFVTHSENMHFAKPDPAYFAEAVARVGVEPDESLVIGDSLKNDIMPAGAIGINTWQVCATHGLEPILKRLRNPNWQHELQPREMTADMLKPQFKGNLAALFGLLADVKAHQWLQRPDPDEWSILQILCHLWRAETEVHQQRLQTILSEDNPFIPSLPPPGPDIPACHDDGMEVFHRYRKERHVTMSRLGGLANEDWRRPARHSIFGLTNLLEMAYFTAQHDRLHITQLCQTLGKCAD